jgi:6-pyruvoyltetrahydropterin/6-carboxytetrahydropterin synthase
MNALGVTLKFDAAHFLPGYNGACSRMHGHTWRVDFGFQYDPEGLDACGIAFDFKELKARLKAILPDHRCLNDIMPKPSAEMLVEFFKRELFSMDGIPPLSRVRVWESEVAFAEWRP